MPIAIAVAVAMLVLTGPMATAQEITVKAPPGEFSGSEFLRPPGSESDADRYAPAVDWNLVPAWKQTTFFGIRAQGKTFIYVVDCSGSMGDNARLLRAKRELRRAVSAMRFPQRFHVLFYNDNTLAMPGGIPQSADAGSRTQLASWLDLIDADGGTDPRSAMSLALAMKPDGVFLLSDGEFPEGAAEAILKTNKAGVPIYCVDMSGGSADLRRIARESGGQYASRP